jgi:hypothetical protein
MIEALLLHYIQYSSFSGCLSCEELLLWVTNLLQLRRVCQMGIEPVVPAVQQAGALAIEPRRTLIEPRCTQIEPRRTQIDHSAPK